VKIKWTYSSSPPKWISFASAFVYVCVCLSSQKLKSNWTEIIDVMVWIYATVILKAIRYLCYFILIFDLESENWWQTPLWEWHNSPRSKRSEGAFISLRQGCRVGRNNSIDDSAEFAPFIGRSWFSFNISVIELIFYYTKFHEIKLSVRLRLSVVLSLLLVVLFVCLFSPCRSQFSIDLYQTLHTRTHRPGKNVMDFQGHGL